MKISKRTAAAAAAATLLALLGTIWFCQVWAEPLSSGEELTVSEPWKSNDSASILFFGREMDAFKEVADGFDGNTTIKTQECVVVAVDTFWTQWCAEDGNLYETPSKGEATGDRAQLYFLLSN